MFRPLLFFLLSTLSSAYIPALPSNASTEESQSAQGIPINQTDSSSISLTGGPGINTLQVSYQIAGNGSKGLSQGALVHFSEDLISNNTNDLTTTPWIAFVACDRNASNASQSDDIFTLAQERGAVGALLYSQYSNACLIDAEYLNTSEFNRLFDIFSTKKLVDSIFIENQYMRIPSQYYNYSAVGLNNSINNVTNAIGSGEPMQPGYFIATLLAYNATASPNTTTPGQPGGNAHQNGGQNNSANTGLAMIILYAITGCVSALFCVVILSGAVRAIRHPERYGPRPDDPSMGGGGRSRTAGLGRAILDTFPVIKFGSETSPTVLPVNNSGVKAVEMHDMSPSAPNSPHDQAENENENENENEGSRPSSSTPPEVDPDAIGHETCPICIVDFSNGDDLRVLPCEGKHRFHQECVDPWLLEMSSSCPLCREDFLTLETMVQGGPPPATLPTTTNDSRPGLVATTSPVTPPSRSRRHTIIANPNFSKYLRFAQRRRRAAATQ